MDVSSEPTIRDQGSQRPAWIAVLLFVAPFVAFPMVGPFEIVAVPLLAAFLGPQIWPDLRRGRAALVGTAWVVAALAGSIAVIPTYGLCAPSEAIGVVPPIVGLLVYAAAAVAAFRRSAWLWPAGTFASLAIWGLLGLALAATGAQFSC